MEMVPARAAPLLLATEYVTVPFAEPLPPAVTASQGSLLVAVHGQPAAVVTATVPVAAPASNERLRGSSSMRQPTPIWRKREVTPLSVMSPWRGLGPGLGAIWYCSCACLWL